MEGRLRKVNNNVTRINRTNHLPTQQTPSNTPNNSSVRPETPTTKPWYPFWGGKHRKTHRRTRHYKPRGGNPYSSGMEYLSPEIIAARKAEAEQALADATFEYQRVSQLYKQNPKSYEKMAFEYAAAVKNAKNTLYDIQTAEEKAMMRQIRTQEDRGIKLGRSLNNAAIEARSQEAPRSSWISRLPKVFGRGRKSHHNTRHHKRRGSRKTLRK